MDQKTVGIIATIATVLLCGCPGLAFMCTGAFATLGTFIPGAEIDEPQMAILGSFVMLCVGALMLLVPLLVGFFTLRRRNSPAASQIIDYDEPLPPAI